MENKLEIGDKVVSYFGLHRNYQREGEIVRVTETQAILANGKKLKREYKPSLEMEVHLKEVGGDNYRYSRKTYLLSNAYIEQKMKRIERIACLTYFKFNTLTDEQIESILTIINKSNV